jgi:hypothetical protein
MTEVKRVRHGYGDRRQSYISKLWSKLAQWGQVLVDSFERPQHKVGPSRSQAMDNGFSSARGSRKLNPGIRGQAEPEQPAASAAITAACISSSRCRGGIGRLLALVCARATNGTALCLPLAWVSHNHNTDTGSAASASGCGSSCAILLSTTAACYPSAENVR